MSQAIQIFEKQLKNKLEYKASSKISPDTFLYKSFKFFDLYNNGYLSKSDFFKAIAKCGVVVDTHDMQAIYSYYDFHHDGNIHYKDFIEKLLFSDTQQNKINTNQSQISQNNITKSKRQIQPSQLNSHNINDLNYNQNLKDKSNKANVNLKQSNINRLYQNCQTFAEVLQSIKKHLRESGQLSSLLNFAVSLKATDTNKTHKINKVKLMNKLGFLTENSVNLIIKEYSEEDNHIEQINYAQLIYVLKGQLELAQQSVIDRAFQSLDVRGQRQVQIQRVIANFKYNQYKGQFQDAIALYSKFQGINDGVFTDQDFIDLFGFIAFAFSQSQQFINFVQKAYLNFDTQSQASQRSNRSREFNRHSGQALNQLNRSNIQHYSYEKQVQDFRKNKQQQKSTYRYQYQNNSPHQKVSKQLNDSKRSQPGSQIDKKSSTTSYYVKQVQMIVLRIKKRLASKGTRGYLIFQKSLKQVDTDYDGLINLDQLKKVIKDQKIDITNNQCNLFFDVFDPESTNLISYSEILETLKGEMPEKEENFLIEGHPDIQTGRRYDDQIIKQLNQTILLIQELNQTPKSENISKKQFREYFQNLSLSISQDQLFESILNNFWKMQSKTNIAEMYAGSRKLFDPKQKSYLMDHHRYAVKGGTISSNAPYGTSSQPTNYVTQHQNL